MKTKLSLKPTDGVRVKIHRLATQMRVKRGEYRIITDTYACTKLKVQTNQRKFAKALEACFRQQGGTVVLRKGGRAAQWGKAFSTRASYEVITWFERWYELQWEQAFEREDKYAVFVRKSLGRPCYARKTLTGGCKLLRDMGAKTVLLHAEATTSVYKRWRRALEDSGIAVQPIPHPSPRS